jgi:hypothetical protein
MQNYARAALAALSIVTGVSVAIAEEVGKTSAIIPAAAQQAQGTRSDLNLHDPIIRNAELVTAERGALEVTFVDGSKLTMGQNSRLTVDEYVYAGPGGAGKQSIRYTKGLFRFVSGSIPKENVKIETPTVTIGIRGTDFKSAQNEDGSGATSVGHGQVVIIKKKDGEKIVLEAGQMVTYDADGTFGAIGKGQLQGCQ